jgi:hypothetical protein
MVSIWRVLVRRFSRRREIARLHHAKSGEKNKEKNDMRCLLLSILIVLHDIGFKTRIADFQIIRLK